MKNARIVIAVVTLAMVLSISAFSVPSVFAAKHSVTQTKAASVCKNSQGFINWWGYGEHVSHCDLQGINSFSDAYAVASAVASFYSPGAGLLAASLWAYKSFLQSKDNGNGIYIGYPWVGGGPYYWVA